MAGLFDGLFGGGDQQQTPEQQARPQADGMFDRLRATYAPNAYAAHQQSLQQQAVYDAMVKTAGPEMARAMATNPQFFQAANQAFLPAAPQSQVLQDQFGGQSIGQILNKGGGAGHGMEYSGLNIVNPPGTTQNPAQATQGAVHKDPQDGTSAVQPQNTLTGMPGGIQSLLDTIKANKAAGRPADEWLPYAYKYMTRAVLEGKQTLKDVFESRGKGMRTVVNELALAQDPDFSESASEARKTYLNQWNSEKATDAGGQIKSLNKLYGSHIPGMIDAAVNMDNVGMGGIGAIAHPINKLGNAIFTTPGAGLKRASDLYNTEFSNFISGKGGSGVDERKERNTDFSPNRTPQEMGTALLKDIEYIEGQQKAMEQHRDSVFKNTTMGQRLPVVDPQAQQQLNQAKIKAHKQLVGDFDEWSKTADGQKTLGTAGGTAPAAGALPAGWSVK